MLRICVADDDKKSIDRLRSFLLQFFTLRKDTFELTAFPDGEALVKNYAPVYDIIFLDIEMPGLDGMRAAEMIREKDRNTVIIFLTHMAQYAVRGYEVNAFDFIVKPVDYNSFAVKLGRAIAEAARQQEYRVEIRMDGDCLWLPTSAIYFIEVNKHDVTYHTDQGDFTARGSLNELQDRLWRYGFRPCSRYCLVNMKHVTGIYDWFILVHGEKIEVSRRRRKEMMDALLDYYGGNGDA